MSRRFHPTGKGWIRVVDYGDAAAWLRPSQDGLGVEAVVWMYNWKKEGSATPWEVWEVYEPRPVEYVDEVFNKMHRIRHLADPDRLKEAWLDGEAKEPAGLAREHAIRWTMKEAGPPPRRPRHRRRNWSRSVWLGRTWPFWETWAGHRTRMPRKLRKALYG